MGGATGLSDSDGLAMINVFFAATMLLGLGMPLLPAKSDVAERRLYWAGALVATVSAFLVVYPPDWQAGLIFASVVAAVMTLRAYMTTSYLRIRGRTYAFNLADSGEDSSGDGSAVYAGFATAPKMWWLFVAVSAGCSAIIALSLTSSEGQGYAIGSAFVLGMLPVVIGHQDASWGHRVARGQTVQLAVAGVATLGLFALMYALGYSVGTRVPLRSKRSPEVRRRAEKNRE